MGQGTSSTDDRKRLGSIILGYKAVTTIYTKHHHRETLDNLLFKPFLYGLDTSPPSKDQSGSSNSDNSNSNSSSSSSINTTRTDSGFLLCEKDSQLWNDLIYVDQTYYAAYFLKPSCPPEPQDMLFGDVFTVDDVPTTSTMQDVDLSKRNLGLISPTIGLLPMIRKLDLSYNQLKDIPEAIGHLQQLETLSLSHNQINSIPDTICHLTRLTEFNLSYNQIKELTPYIGDLKSLQTLNIAHNQLQGITVSIGNISNLTLLDLSYNPLAVLPAEITQLPFLRRFRFDGCPFTNTLDHQYQLEHNPPSLLETCARLILKSENQPQEKLKPKLTESLYNYLSRSKTCSHCNGPYFESYVSRGRWVERNDIWVPLEYRLCSAHWIDESDRVYAMFSACSMPRSTMKIRPPLVALDATQTPSRSQRQPRGSSITAGNYPSQLEQQQQIGNFSLDAPLSTAVKRWRFKVRNNSSFLKNHRLCS